MASSRLSPLAEFRNNPRLRLGIWLIAAIMAVYGALWLDDQRALADGEYAEAVERLARLQGIVEEPEWPQRALAGRSLLLQAESLLWGANSKGLAQAIFQTWLDNQVGALKMENVRVKVEEAQETGDTFKLWRTAGQIEGVWQADQLHQLLGKMAESPQWIVVERLEIRQSPQARFSLVVSAYFQTRQESPG
jgi:hypothetical protein